MKPLIGISLMFIKFSLLPNQNLMFWMGVAIVLDFLTGFTKAIYQRVARTSGGMRKTISKFIQYGGALAVGIILAHAAEEKGAESLKGIINYFNDGLVVFIIYIEVTSIFENLVAIDNKSTIARYFYSPMLKLLTAQFKKLPVNQVAEAVAEKPAS